MNLFNAGALQDFLDGKLPPKRSFWYKTKLKLAVTLFSLGEAAAKYLEKHTTPLEQIHLAFDLLKIDKELFRSTLAKRAGAYTDAILTEAAKHVDTSVKQ